MQSHFGKGVLFALCAAALNATIGVLSKVLMNSGFSSSSIALIKTVLCLPHCWRSWCSMKYRGTRCTWGPG